MAYIDRRSLKPLSPQQQKAIMALVGSWQARTYLEASAIANMNINTFMTHLKRVKANHPTVYSKVQKVRSEHLAKRHEEALEREDEHRHEYLKMVAHGQYRMLHQMGLGHIIPRI